MPKKKAKRKPAAAAAAAAASSPSGDGKALAVGGKEEPKSMTTVFKKPNGKLLSVTHDVPLETRTERRARERREVRLHDCTHPLGCATMIGVELCSCFVRGLLKCIGVDGTAHLCRRRRWRRRSGGKLAAQLP